MQDVGKTVSRQTLAATHGQQQVIQLASCTPARPALEVTNFDLIYKWQISKLLLGASDTCDSCDIQDVCSWFQFACCSNQQVL